jgi:hypothetical protein
MVKSADNSTTRVIVPAPVETQRESGIGWYEVFLPVADESTIDVATRSRHKPVAQLDVLTTSDRETKSVITGEGVNLALEVNSLTDSSHHQLEVLVKGERLLITGDPSHAESVAVTGGVDLTEYERAALMQWGRLRDPMRIVVEATRQSWGCGACLCLVAGAVVACAACVGGNLAACAAALGMDATGFANCEGVCPTPSFVAVGGMAGVPVILSE